MKKILILAAIAAALILSATCVSAAVLSPGLSVIAENTEMKVSALKGETVVFSEEAFSEAVGAKSYEKLKITALPDASAGKLYYEDVCVTENQVIRAESVSKLSFVPEAEITEAEFCFLFDDAYEMTCSVVFTDKVNSAPTALEAPVLSAFVSTSSKGELRAHDAEGDSLFFEVVEYPEGGKLQYDSKTGEFTYTAGSRVMNDSFTYRVKDSMGNTSEICEYTVSVRENKSRTTLSDMEESSSPVAAVTMTEKGYMSAVESEGELCFYPGEAVTRLDFLVCTMNVFGAGNIPKVESTGFSDDEMIPEEYKGYVYSAAKLGIISSPEDGAGAFRPDDSITRAEAGIILNSIIGYEAKQVTQVAGTPVWAQEAVCAMYELGVYDLENGEAASSLAVTRDMAADMLYKVHCLLGE
ncbi:MAG: S-layer homology domain-containing protein [Clostridia bacterium]|nr:S-layer homology domain-containing protein [Clostridia bacterium]